LPKTPDEPGIAGIAISPLHYALNSFANTSPSTEPPYEEKVRQKLLPGMVFYMY